MKSLQLKKQQSGVTIVEILISMALGLIIMSIVAQVFFSSSLSQRVQDLSGAVQEKGQFSLEFIVNDIRRAGFPGYLQAGSIALHPNSDDTNGQSDTLVIQYEPVSGITTDCLGQNVAGPVIINTYFLNIATNQLMCRGNGGPNPQALIDNVETFQVLIGVDDNLADTEYVPTTYVRIPTAEALFAVGAGLAEPQGQLQIVKSIRIGLLLSSTAETGDTAPPVAQTFQVLDTLVNPAVAGGWGVDLNDGRIRRVFESTVVLRNSLRSTNI